MKTKAFILLLLLIGGITSTHAQFSSKISENRTSLIVNPSLDDTDGWTLVPIEKGYGYSYYSLLGNNGCIEGWNTSFDVYQIINDVPNGIYTATVQGFYQNGNTGSALEKRSNGIEEIHSYLYANNSTTPLMSIFDCVQQQEGNGFSQSTNLGYVPYTMEDANIAFSLGYYSNNSVTFKVTKGTIRLGVKCNKAINGNWTIFDNFKLYYNGPWDGYLTMTYKVDKNVYASFTLKEGDKIPPVENPQKDGYTFIGWKVEGYEIMPETMPDNDIEAIAIFEKEYDTPDRTSLIVNPGLDGTDGWRDTNNHCGYGSGCVEAYNNNFDFYQYISSVKNGIYTATVQGFYREGGGPYRADPTTRINGTEQINAFLYANDSSTPLTSIFDCVQTKQSDAFCESTSIGYVPTSMSSASEAFSLGYYSNNTVIFRVTDETITLGIRNKNSVSGDWTIFDNFKIYYNGPLGYNVLNYMVNGELYASFYLNEGDEIPSVEDPLKEGYKFIGWEAQGYNHLPKTMPAKDIIINAVLEKMVEAKEATALITEVEKYESAEIPASVLKDMADAKETFLTYKSETNYNALVLALEKVKQWAEAYSSAKAYLNRMAVPLESTNFYTDEAFEQYYNRWLTKYINKTLTLDEASKLSEESAWTNIWHTANNIDDVLLSCWTIGGKKCKDYDTSLYINTWSVEGNTDDSDFLTPFFEYFNEYNTLNTNTFQATIRNLIPNSQYSVSLWARLRSTGTNNIKNGAIFMQVGNGDKVSLTSGDNVKNTNFYIGHFIASGSTDASGVLKLTITVNSGSNVNWLSFKDVYYFKENTKLVVNLPEDAKDGRYNNMYIEVQNTDNNQTYKCLISNLTSYSFSNLNNNTEYNIYVKNETGDILGKKEKVKVDNEDVTVTFEELLQPRTLTAKVLTPEGNDVTENTTIIWLKADGSILSTGASLKGLIVGTNLICRISLQQSLALQYNTPVDVNYTVKASENTISFRLKPYDVISLSGKVFDSNTRKQIPYASITVSQLLNDKNTKSFNVLTNNEGVYTINVFNTHSSITFSANNYLSKSLEFDNFTNSKIDDVFLDAISGSVISINLTYTTSAEESQTPVTQNWYIDESNVTYSIINQSQNKEITNYIIQNGYIIILEDVQKGDVLEITAQSKIDMFSDVTVTTTLDNQNHANVTIPIIELGSLQASYTKSDNNTVVGILYDNNGVLLRKLLFEGNAMTMSDIPDGNYIFVTMGHSTFFNSILNLSELNNTMLSEGKDYVKNNVTISSGRITKLNINSVPTFDESKFYFTNENTAFTSNKSKVTVGNYITLRANIGFKNEYASDISDIKLIVDLPESCSFVENSMLIGNKQATYSLSNNRVVVDLDQLDDKVLFCLVPTTGGTYQPNAFVEFKYKGKTIQQPIGSAYYIAENLSFFVPSTTNSSMFTVIGKLPINYYTNKTQSKYNVMIYDGDELIGQTNSMSNGRWSCQINLNNPINLSTHNIYAKITNENGFNYVSETIKCTYDQDAKIDVSKVIMYHWNPELNNWRGINYEIVFDFQNPYNIPGSYVYYIYNRKFTFTIDFTINDPSLIYDVVLYVQTGDRSWTALNSTYDVSKKLWVAEGEFGNMYDGNIPINVAVDFKTNIQCRVDRQAIDDGMSSLTDAQESLISSMTTIDELFKVLDEEYEKDKININLVNSIEKRISDLTGISFETSSSDDTDITDEDLINDCEELFQQLGNSILDGFINTKNSDWDILKEHLDGVVITSCKDYTPEQLLDRGFTKIESTDKNNPIYYYSSDSECIIADFFSDKYVEINNLNAGIKDRNGVITKAGGNDIYSWADKIKDAAEKLKDAAGAIDGVINHIEESLSKQNADLESKLLRLNSKIKLKEVLNPQYYNDVNYYKLKRERKEIIKRIEKNKTIASFLKNNLKHLHIGKVFSKGFSIADIALTGINAWQTYTNKIIPLYESITEDCPEAKQLHKEIEAWGIKCGVYYVGNILASATQLGLMSGGILGAIPSGGTSLAAVVIAIGITVANISASYYFENQLKTNYDYYNYKIKNLKCDDKDDDDKDDDNNTNKPNGKQSGNKDAENTIDPSGYVYEGVPSNRLQGVKATAYYKEKAEDMYGELHEETKIWNAEEYAQNNPLFTDEYGLYHWDVPQGLWQVKFEKEGYETTYSDWLPVPPPQLEINIGMVQSKKPEVKQVHGYMDGVEVEFDKYMIPDLLNTNNIMVSQNGKTVEGKIVLLNSESTYNDENIKYASKLRFVPTIPFNTSEVTLTILNNVKSYAGLTMEEDFKQTIDVELEMTSIETISDIDLTCEEEYVLTVTVLPADASKGKTIYVRTSSPMIAAVDKESYVLDKDGKAEIKVMGDLPGSASLFYTIEGYDLMATTNVRVNFAVPVFLPLPFASVISGTSMYRGTEIELFSSDQNLKIWYTTDGSCPCDENGTRKEYTGSIVINEDVVINAITENENGETSEVATYKYTILRNNRGVELNEGWQWVSFNMQNNFLNDVNKALESGTWTDNDEIKNMHYSDSYSSQNRKWFGTLSLHGNINNISMYKIHSSSAQMLNIIGEAVNPSNVSIELGPNWNYISYLPLTAMSVEEALEGYNAQDGDMIKSQDAFAVYSSAKGWEGDLKRLQPGEGYMMKRGGNATTTSFHYPSLYSSNSNIEVKPRNGIHKYSGNMNIIGKVVYDDWVEGDSIIAIVNGEMRGRCAVNKDAIVFMTIEGDNSYDVSLAIVRDGEIVSTANNHIKYVNDEVIGSLSYPTAIQFQQSGNVNVIQTYPNIVEDLFNVNINLTDIHSVGITIYNLNGLKVVDLQDNNLSLNQYQESINLTNISSGVYIVNITVNNESHIVRIIKK